MDQHALFLPEGLGGEAACDLQRVGGIEVKVYRRHRGTGAGGLFRAPYFLPACRRTNRTSSGTGRAVEPFSRPLFHAVPATSRCAQRILRVKRARKHAAVIAPPGRPPMFAK